MPNIFSSDLSSHMRLFCNKSQLYRISIGVQDATYDCAKSQIIPFCMFAIITDEYNAIYLAVLP